MQKTTKKYSLARDYFIIFASILVAIALLSIFYTYSVYSSKKKIKQNILFNQSNKISRDLASSFDYVVNLSRFMGTQIAEKDNRNNLKFIAELLRGRLITSELARQQFAWSVFDWSGPDKKIIASTNYGILKTPIDISFRHYAKMASTKPWALYFDKPSVGVPSGQWIIPAGMGVSDEYGNLIGIISLGFNIAKLNHLIESNINNEAISFLVLDENNNIALYSSDHNSNKINKDSFVNLLENNQLNNNQLNDNIGILKEKIIFKDVIYSNYAKLDGYPFTVLVGYNKALATQELTETLLPGIAGYSIIGIVALVLLVILRKLIIEPVIYLSDIADKIAKGEDIKKIRVGRTYEINNLALKLIKVKNLLHKQQRIQNQQKEVLQIIRNSDEERELFFRQLSYTINNQLSLIVLGTKILQQYKYENNIDNYKTHLDIIYNAARQIECFTTDIIEPKLFDINAIIKCSIKIQQKKAHDLRVNIIADLTQDTPLILADELRIKQVIVAILGHSLACLQDFGNINLSTQIHMDKQDRPVKLMLKISDDGLGFDEEQREELWQKAYSREPSRYNFDMTSLSFGSIRHLLMLHNGELHISADPKIGTVFTIMLFYNYENTNLFKTNKTTRPNSQTISNNIIQFPKK